MSGSTYRSRVLDRPLDDLFPHLPAVSIEGARGVGKTTTALQRAVTVHRLDDPGKVAAVEADPSILVSGQPPILVDEWQRLPYSWDVVRRAVDADPSGGRFLLTGSATPTDLPTHSGAGRIITMRMRPMTLTERGLAAPTVSLGQMIAQSSTTITGRTDVSLGAYVAEIVNSGLPAFRGLPEDVVRAHLDGYLAHIIDRDFPELGRPIRNRPVLLRWLRAYAAAISTTASLESIRDAATGGQEHKPAKTTVSAYLDVLERSWVVEPVPAWLPTRNHLSRLGSSPKHQLVDPALAVRLLGGSTAALVDARPLGPPALRDPGLLGRLFESLVTLSVRVYAEACDSRVGHLRTRSGEHEIDLIVERSDHRALAVETKLSHRISDSDVKHLLWLKERLGDDLLDMVVVNTGTHAYRRSDGVAVVPAALLGP